MEVHKKTISTVFSPEHRYIIPLFQRPYIWSKERQWEPLWEDIRDRADEMIARPKEVFPVHFLGAIVVQQRSSWGDQLPAHEVIDGQQRLTTFQILLAALRDIAKERGEAEVLPWLEEWTQNKKALADRDVEQFKVWPTSRDVDQFTLVTSAGSPNEVEKRHPPIYRRKRLVSRPRMVEAYLYFHEVLSEWLDQDGNERFGERLKVLRRVFVDRLLLVSIELAGNEDPQAIFETLNARGVPLLASDLLRNFIFQRAGTPEEAGRLHEIYWRRFEVPVDDDVPDGPRFWEVEERQGRLTRARLDLFVQHYLSMNTSEDIPTGQLYPLYKKWIEKGSAEMGAAPFGNLEKELQDFTYYAEHFRALLVPDVSTPIGRLSRWLRVIDTSTVYPLALFLAGNSRIGDEDRERIYRDLESFLLRRLICGRTIKNYNRLFLQLMIEFAKAEEQSHNTFHHMLASGKGEAVDWPTDKDFETSWMTIDAYRELKAARVEKILRELDAAIEGSTGEKITIQDALTVEHIIPQQWKEHWPLPEGLDPQDAADKREEAIHDFGNLTLLTAKLNTTVSNGPAAVKLPQIASQSRLLLNGYFQGKATWDENDIEERGRSLFQIAKKIWVGP